VFERFPKGESRRVLIENKTSFSAVERFEHLLPRALAAGDSAGWIHYLYGHVLPSWCVNV
jgi:hypothetical protein